MGTRHHTSTLHTPDGARLFTQAWSPENGGTQGALIVVHGYGEHSGRFASVAEFFNEHGYAVFSYDQRGHGRSSAGKLGYFARFSQLSDDLRLFIEHTQAQLNQGRMLFIYAQSMGGLVTLHYVVRHQPPLRLLRGLVLSSPYLDAGVGEPPLLIFAVRNVLSPLLPHFGVRAIDSSTLSRDPAVRQAFDSDPLVFHGKGPARVAAEFIEARQMVWAELPRVRLPLLVMHGTADRLVSHECARIVYERAGSADKTIKLYEGMYHELHNEPERMRVLNDVRVWIAAHRTTAELRLPG